MNNIILLDEIKDITNNSDAPLNVLMDQGFVNMNSTLNSILAGLPPAPGSKQWTTPGTYTFIVPPKVTTIRIEMTGAGGGGGGTALQGITAITTNPTAGGPSSISGVSANGGAAAPVGQASTPSDQQGEKNTFAGAGDGGDGSIIDGGNHMFRASGGKAGVVVNTTMSVTPGQSLIINIGRGGKGAVLYDYISPNLSVISYPKSGQDGAVKISW